MRGALRQYVEMHERGVDEIRLMTDLDAQDGNHPDARSANAATLIAAALMCEDGWQVVIYPPRDHGPEYEELLRRVAAFAVRDGSRQAGNAFAALCKLDKHFGRARGEQKQSRMLREASKQLQDGVAD